MKRFLKIFLPILLSVVILIGIGWYFLEYDKYLTQSILMDLSHHFSNRGDYEIAAWLNDLAFNYFGNDDAVPLEQAQLYIKRGNYTQAERVLHRGIENGGGLDLYVMLCQIYVQQDKLLDAAEFLDSITDTGIKQELDSMRPGIPTPSHPTGEYHKYEEVSFGSTSGTVYVREGNEYPSTEQDYFSGKITLHDGENRFSCITVGENGLVSPLSTYTYVVGGIVEQVHFTDSAMEQEIRKLLDIGEDRVVYSNEIWTIREFTVPQTAKSYAELKYMPYLEKLTVEKGIAGQFTYLEKMPDLKQLTITNTTVTSEELAIIGSLKNLTDLTLSGCGLTTVAPLQTLSKLVTLDLSNNTIRNLDVVSQMKDLKSLNLQHNAVNDLSALSTNSGLQALDLSYNSIVDLAPISSLSSLQQLNVHHNSVTDLAVIPMLSNLLQLNVSYNGLLDIAPLSACIQLTHLNIAGNSISDIQSLAGLVNLADLDFSYNNVTTLPAFSRSCKLVTIDGSYNDIRSVAPLSGLMKLNNVLLDYNKNLSDVAPLSNCQLLVLLNVFGTKVKNVAALVERGVVVNYNPVG